MPQPTPYDKTTTFAETLDAQLKAKIDSELDAVEQTLDETLANLALIQRDDGTLANESVGTDQLTAELAARFDGLDAVDLPGIAEECAGSAAAAAASEVAAAASASQAGTYLNQVAIAKTMAEAFMGRAETAAAAVEGAEELTPYIPDIQNCLSHISEIQAAPDYAAAAAADRAAIAQILDDITADDYFDLDPNGDLMPANDPTHSDQFELDGSGDLMPA